MGSLWAYIREKLLSKTKRYEIYTDGSLMRSEGAWAFVIVLNNEVVHQASGWLSHKHTQRSNNRMEYQAAIEALTWLPLNSCAIVYSDSRNLIDTATLWIGTWAQQGWVKKNKKPLPDSDQIQQLYALMKKHDLEWKWVRAHAGNVFNEHCDKLCRLQLNLKT